MSSLVIPADVKAADWCSPDGRHKGRFNPYGEIALAYPRQNPVSWTDAGPLYSARIFVGFNVDDKPKWTMEDLVKVVKSTRRHQVGIEDHSILYQHGTYTSKKSRKVNDEKGGQVLVLNLPEYQSTLKQFRSQMIKLAENIRTNLRQEEVILELQKNGYRIESVGVMSQEAIDAERRREREKEEQAIKRTNPYEVLASGPSKERLIRMIANFYGGAAIRLEPRGEIHNANGRIEGVRWVYKSKRYRFEKLGTLKS